MYIFWLVVVWGYLVPVLFIWAFVVLSYKFKALDDKGVELFSNKRYYSEFCTTSVIPAVNLFLCISICWFFLDLIIAPLYSAPRIFVTITVKNILKKVFGDRV